MDPIHIFRLNEERGRLDPSWVVRYPRNPEIDSAKRIDELRALLERSGYEDQRVNIEAAISMYKRGFLPDPSNTLVKIQDGAIVSELVTGRQYWIEVYSIHYNYERCLTCIRVMCANFPHNLLCSYRPPRGPQLLPGAQPLPVLQPLPAPPIFLQPPNLQLPPPVQPAPPARVTSVSFNYNDALKGLEVNKEYLARGHNLNDREN
jgi:hypothetical protein